jgi:hypothetical protein
LGLGRDRQNRAQKQRAGAGWPVQLAIVPLYRALQETTHRLAQIWNWALHSSARSLAVEHCALAARHWAMQSSAQLRLEYSDIRQRAAGFSCTSAAAARSAAS